MLMDYNALHNRVYSSYTLSIDNRFGGISIAYLSVYIALYKKGLIFEPQFKSMDSNTKSLSS